MLFSGYRCSPTLLPTLSLRCWTKALCNLARRFYLRVSQKVGTKSRQKTYRRAAATCTKGRQPGPNTRFGSQVDGFITSVSPSVSKRLKHFTSWLRAGRHLRVLLFYRQVYESLDLLVCFCSWASNSESGLQCCSRPSAHDCTTGGSAKR